MWPWPQRRARAPAGRAVTGCAGLCPRPPPPHPPVPVTQQVDDASRGLELAWIGNQGLTLEDTSSSTQSHLKTPPAPSSPRGTRYCIGVPAQRPARGLCPGACLRSETLGVPGGRRPSSWGQARWPCGLRADSGHLAASAVCSVSGHALKVPRGVSEKGQQCNTRVRP